MVTVRIILSLAAMFHWPVFQMDVNNAFLQGDLEEEVYMSLPQGFSNQGEQVVCRLLKPLYGLKQASRQWNIKLTQVLVQHGYSQSKHDYSLFTKHEGNKVVMMLVYVDDILITGNDDMLIEDLKRMLKNNFKIKDLGDLKYFLGIEVARSKKGMVLNQRKYALELIEEAGLAGSKVFMTPLEQNQKLTSKEYDLVCKSSSSDELLEDPASYRRLVGRLLYLTMTRPDICFTVQTLSQFMASPKKSHMEAALRVVKYIKGKPGLGILLPADNTQSIIAFCDSDWASCPMSRKSVTGFCIKLGNSPVSWKAKKQSTVSRSSAEAEYRSMAMTVSEVIWIVGLMKELGVNNITPIQLLCDNKAALQIAANPIFHERTKHIEIDCHFVREKLQDGTIVTGHVSTEEQLADIFTKTLGRQQHEKLMNKIGMFDIHQRVNLRGSVTGAS